MISDASNYNQSKIKISNSVLQVHISLLLHACSLCTPHTRYANVLFNFQEGQYSFTPSHLSVCTHTFPCAYFMHLASYCHLSFNTQIFCLVSLFQATPPKLCNCLMALYHYILSLIYNLLLYGLIIICMSIACLHPLSFKNLNYQGSRKFILLIYIFCTWKTLIFACSINICWMNEVGQTYAIPHSNVYTHTHTHTHTHITSPTLIKVQITLQKGGGWENSLILCIEPELIQAF
jgi:hypothetical protein